MWQSADNFICGFPVVCVCVCAAFFCYFSCPLNITSIIFAPHNLMHFQMLMKMWKMYAFLFFSSYLRLRIKWFARKYSPTKYDRTDNKKRNNLKRPSRFYSRSKPFSWLDLMQDLYDTQELTCGTKYHRIYVQEILLLLLWCTTVAQGAVKPINPPSAHVCYHILGPFYGSFFGVHTTFIIIASN